MTSAFTAGRFPRFSRLVAIGDTRALSALYHRSSQAMGVLVLPAAAVLALLYHEIMLRWTQSPEAAEATRVVLALFAVGTALNGLMNVPYALQLATGWTRLAMYANLVAIGKEVQGVYNVGTAQETTVNDLFRLLAELTGSGWKELHGPAKKGEQARSVVDPSKYRHDWGWDPRVSLQDGLRRAIAELQKLDDHTLRDIGLTRSEIPSVVHGCGKDYPRRYNMHEAE
jgi:hypothetical protein